MNEISIASKHAYRVLFVLRRKDDIIDTDYDDDDVMSDPNT